MAFLYDKLTGFFTYFRSSRTLSATAWYVIGTGIEKIISFSSIILLAQWLTPDEIGIYSVFSSWLSILAILLTLNLSFAVTPAFFEFDDETFADFISAITALGWGLTIVAGVLLWVLPQEIVETFLGLQTHYLILILFWTFSVHPYGISQFIWKAEYNYKVFVGFQILGLATQFIVGFLFIYLAQTTAIFDDPIFAFVLGMTLVKLGIGVVLGIRRLQNSWLLISQKYWCYAVVISGPLILHVLSHSVLTRADQIMIANIIGDTEAGIYAIAYRMGEISTLIWSAVSNVWLVWFKEKLEANELDKIRRGANIYALCFSLTIFGLVIGGMLGVYYIFPIDYRSGTPLVPLVASGGFFSVLYSFYVTVEYYEKKSIQIAIATSIAAAFNIMLNVWLLPIYGIDAAAWTTVVSYLLIFILHGLYTTRILKKDYFDNHVLILLASIVLCVIIVMYLLGSIFI